MRPAVATLALMPLLAAPLALAQNGQPAPIITRPAPIILQPAAAVDLTVRPALYFGGTVKDVKSMNAGSRYVVAGQKIVLTKADSFLQSGGQYAFNVGYYVFGSPSDAVLSAPEFTDRLRLNNAGVVNQHKVKFAGTDAVGAGTRIAVVHTQVYLPLGESVVVLSVDDDKAVPESNEANNTFRFLVEVRP